MRRTRSKSPLPPVLLFAALAAGCADHDSGRTLPVVVVTPAFETRTEIATGTPSHADAALTDLNGDGALDLAVISLSGEFQVLLGNGNGTFTPAQGLALGGDPIWMRNADLDSDGDQDLVVVRTAGRTASLLFNDGNGTFTPGPDLAVGPGALSVVLGDADDDGLLDVVVATLPSPQITVYLGDGQGGFTAGSSLVMPGGGSPFTMSIGDVTGNGRSDLVVCDQTFDRLLIYEGNTLDFDPVPMSVPMAGGPRAVSIGDLNGDGSNDMAVSLFNANQLFVVTQVTPVGVQGFTANVEGAPTLSRIADVTGDGRNDLIAAVAGRARISIFVQGPGGVLQEEVQMNATGMPLRPMVGDVDRDGRTDLVVLSGLGDRINLYRGLADGRLNGSHSFSPGPVDPEWLAGADFDGDGMAEVATGGTGSTTVGFLRAVPAAPGSMQRSLEPVLQVDLGLPVHRLHAIDLDGDDRPEVVAAVRGGVRILHNRSTPGALAFDLLPAAGPLPVGNGPFGLDVADLNRDGLPDLVVADFSAEELAVFMGTGTGIEFSSAAQRMPVANRPVDVATADFSGDGVPDVAVSRSGIGAISIYVNDGSGNLRHSVDLPVGTVPTYLVAADMDGNGRDDLVVSNSDADSVSVLFARPGGFVTASFPAGRTPTALLAEDLTQDGFPDILVASLQDGAFSVLAGDGLGGFPAVFRFPGVLGASSALLEDLNGDSLPELMLTSLIDSRVSLFRNASTIPPR